MKDEVMVSDEEILWKPGFYRVEFDDQQRNYFTSFHTGPNDLYPTIQRIIKAAEEHGITDIWWFFEPYAEVTWYANDETFLKVAAAIVDEDEIGARIKRAMTPDDGEFFNWYGKTRPEVVASARAYAEIRKVSQAILNHREEIEGGLGLDCHYARALHVLANQLGMNYLDEGWASLKHGLVCLGFFFFNPHAVAATCRKFGLKTGLTF